MPSLMQLINLDVIMHLHNLLFNYNPCCLCLELWYWTIVVVDKVNGIAFHPTHGTLATVGSDGRFSFWDKDARTKLKTSEQLDQPITCCCFNAHGNIFAYASSYDWSKASSFWSLCTVLCSSVHNHFNQMFVLIIIPAKERDYVFTGVGLSVCYHDN